MKNRIPVLKNKFSLRQSGFTLIEVIIVLGIIGALISVILPRLGLSFGSQMSISLREFTETARATYDSAILTGRVHRLVMRPKTGEYWPEEAPLGYVGRPPADIIVDKTEDDAKKDERAKFIEDLDKAAEEQARTSEKKTPEGEERKYSVRSILLAQRGVLQPLKWAEVNDTVLFRHTLTGSVVFASLKTDAMMDLLQDKVQYETAEKDATVSLYFFPSGYSNQGAIQFSVLKDGNTIDDEGPKFTVVLDPLTGHSQILEGFQDIDFRPDSKK